MAESNQQIRNVQCLLASRIALRKITFLIYDEISEFSGLVRVNKRVGLVGIPTARRDPFLIVIHPLRVR